MTDKRVALVTGASGGIGRAIAKKLASEGIRVIVNYSSSEEKALETLGDIEAVGGKARLLKFDVTDRDMCKQAFDSILEEEKRLDIFVHSAGIRKDGLIMRMKDDDWDRVIDVNLTSFFNLSKLASKVMIKQRWGRIIAISSTSGQAGVAGQFNYSASKAGLIGAVKALAKEIASRNITVNAIAPGFIETEMIKDLDSSKITDEIPMKRLGRSEEVASLAGYLCCEDASYLTGQVIGVNGGLY